MTRITILTTALALATATLPVATAHAGPTVATDLDLGTSTHGGTFTDTTAGPLPTPLYTAGFTLRAGWRFDVAQFFFLPEVGGSYAREFFTNGPDATATSGTPSSQLGRFFGGGRIGWSAAVGPAVRLEPAIFGHAGVGWYGSASVGSAFDVGLSFDVRIRRHFFVGAQVGYDVVTIWHPPAPPPIPGGGPTCIQTATGLVCLTPQAPSVPPQADPWVSYGVHAGWLFW